MAVSVAAKTIINITVISKIIVSTKIDVIVIIIIIFISIISIIMIIWIRLFLLNKKAKVAIIKFNENHIFK